MGSIKNGSITSASAQVSVKGLFNIVLRGLRVVAKQGVQAHDNTRSAEAALAAIAHGDTLLGRMRSLCVADALDGDGMLAVETDKGCQAGVYAGMVDFFRCRVVLADDDCAGTATTFAAAAEREQVY